MAGAVSLGRRVEPGHDRKGRARRHRMPPSAPRSPRLRVMTIASVAVRPADRPCGGAMDPGLRRDDDEGGASAGPSGWARPGLRRGRLRPVISIAGNAAMLWFSRAI